MGSSSRAADLCRPTLSRRARRHSSVSCWFQSFFGSIQVPPERTIMVRLRRAVSCLLLGRRRKRCSGRVGSSTVLQWRLTAHARRLSPRRAGRVRPAAVLTESPLGGTECRSPFEKSQIVPVRKVTPGKVEMTLPAAADSPDAKRHVSQMLGDGEGVKGRTGAAHAPQQRCWS
jgi:hypothetical protein